MTLVDLTLPMPGPGQPGAVATRGTVVIRKAVTYVATRYIFSHDSLQGTYIDLPGHVLETDDGEDAQTWPLEQLAGVRAAVVHLDKADHAGAVSAAQLQAACPPTQGCTALVINALGPRRFDAVAHRSVWLASDAVAWICATGIRLLVSDVYESPQLHGVFLDLFRAHIATVCCPVDLHHLTQPHVRLWALPLRVAGVNQLPCRVYAQMEE